MFSIKHICFLIITSFVSINCSKFQEEQVSKWVKEIGNELWKLGEATTKFKEIQGSYRFLNAQVETKNLSELLDQVTTDIEQMMDRKSDAVTCIQKEAEIAAEMAAEITENSTYEYKFYQYYSSKYSNTSHVTVTLPPSLEENKEMYLNLSEVNNDTHFYNLAVDTHISAVHVPTNIHDRHKDAQFTIQWSEALNEVFVKNYNADPALSWQYFGSTSGILRLYPAKRWPLQYISTDEFDCRDRTWYIEAATCTKDVIVLVDNSGSMDGMGKHIAKLTVINILDTFSNNDYFNVLLYNLTTNYTIPCFEDLLVQATPENIKLFKDAMQKLKPTGKTDLSQALESAFKILEKYRIERGCDNSEGDESHGSPCNQAIMIITDSIARNLSDIILRYNYNHGIRLFTYLIGKEAVNVQDLLWMACANRGFYTHVQTLEQVSSSVLQYINVVARPLVLQAKEHPTSWTHAYADPAYDDTRDDQINEPYRLVTSATVPAFDLRANKNKKTRVANLLGVAGTDVPINDIEKLTLPYKLGVNAHAFIISNNGYVLMHRDLRPMFRGRLRTNYNSLDLVEIEQLDYDLPERIFSDQLVNIRNAIVNGFTGHFTDIPLKYHYNNMKRVARERYNYYYAPLEETPFSLAFAIPAGYGDYSLLVGDEITKDRHITGVKIKDYFFGENWKIHPKWVYCKYHYPEGHEFYSPEIELLHFLEKMYEDDFKWEKQYETNTEEKLTEVVCGRKTHGNNDYYCDRQLVERLVFDAKNTFGAFRTTSWNNASETLMKRFNVTLRFAATMSGLTRWEYISKEVEDHTDQEFGDFHARAIDETWYKSAVLQHQNDPEAFVYSVPLNITNGDEVLVTASYAIFPNDAGKSAPGSVVGYQFAHENLLTFVYNVTSFLSIECTEGCATCETILSCYIIDNNGYIMVSKNIKETGKFFGLIEKDVMASLVGRSIFENVTIYDYQSICFPPKPPKKRGSTASSLSNFVNYVGHLIISVIMKTSSLALEINLFNLWTPHYTHAIDGEDEDDEDVEEPYDCDKKRILYLLQSKLYLRNDFPGEIATNTSMYYLKIIPHSNLLFIAINDTYPRNKGNIDSEDVTEPKEIKYEAGLDLACQKTNLNSLPRRRLKGCFNEHYLEREMKACGLSTTIKISSVIITVLLLLNMCLT